MDAPRDDNFVPSALFEIDGQSGEVMPGQIDQATGRILVDTPSGSGGTVTSVSVASTNGFAGTVATSTTTAVITMKTTINNPVLGGDGTALVSATTTGTGSTVVLQTSPTIITPTIAKLANLVNNGVITTTGSDGTLAVVGTTGTSSVVFSNAPTLTGVAIADTISAVKLTATTVSAVELRATTSTSIYVSSGTYLDIQSYSPASGSTVMLDLSKSNYHRVQMPAGNVVMGLSNQNTGKIFLVDIIQDSVGSRLVTWMTTTRWAGGSAVTLTTTSNKVDTIGIIITSTSNYQGYVVGQNI